MCSIAKYAIYVRKQSKARMIFFMLSGWSNTKVIGIYAINTLTMLKIF